MKKLQKTKKQDQKKKKKERKNFMKAHTQRFILLNEYFK